MKFGLYSSIANPPRGEHLDRCIDETIAEAQLAEASGFDSCFFGEHHQDHDGFLPSPLIVATAVAAAHAPSPRRHLGDPAAAPPSGARGRGRDHPGPRVQGAPHPRRRHRLPAGRLSRVLGADGAPNGACSRRASRSCACAGRARRSRIRASTTRSRTCRFARGPYQASGPPLWFGASVPAAARRAGPARRRIRRHAQHQPGERDGAGRHLQGARPRKAGAHGRGRADARRMGGAHARRGRRGLRPARHGRLSLLLGGAGWRSSQNMPADTKFTLENLAPDRLILGDPEACVREFQRWQKATGASTFLLRLRHAHSGGPPHAKIMEAIQTVRRARSALLLGTPGPISFEVDGYRSALLVFFCCAHPGARSGPGKAVRDPPRPRHCNRGRNPKEPLAICWEGPGSRTIRKPGDLPGREPETGLRGRTEGCSA